MTARTCPCGQPLYPRNRSGLCRVCIRHDPAMQAKRIAAARRAYQLRPELLEAAAARLKAMTKTPEHAARSREMILSARLWEQGVAALGPAGSPTRLKVGKAVSEARLRHIPRERRDDYRVLTTTKRLKADEAARMVIDEHEHAMRAFSRRLAG